MDSHSLWIVFFVSVSTALFISFLCSLMEAALLSLTPSQLADVRRKNPATGDICRKLKHNLDRSIAVILIANTAAHTIGAAVGGAKFEQLMGADKLWLFSVALTFIMVQYTEILPKTVGVKYNRQIMAISARPLMVCNYILSPIIRLVRLLNTPFERKSADNSPNTADEISALAAMARSSQQISSRQERIIRSVPKLSETAATEVMVPAENISMVPSNLSIQDALNLATADFHTRYPVCENGNRDRVIGYINFKELVAITRQSPERTKLSDIIRPINFADPEETAADLLDQVISKHCHLSIVRDAETGKTLGLVTQEDVIEEFLGDLDDEFDPLPRTFYSPGEGLWIVGGGIPVSLLARETHLDLPKRMEPTAIWAARELKHIPRVGDVLKHKNAEFTVRKIRRGRVFEFTIKKI